jgi:3-O-methylgallate 3,4-dioxygenase
MAESVVRVACSHSPQLSTSPAVWPQHAERDRANRGLIGIDGQVHSFDELLSNAPKDLVERLSPDIFAEIHGRMESAAQHCHETLRRANPSVAVVIGNDHKEMFSDDGMPAFAVFAGPTVTDFPLSEGEFEQLPADLKYAQWAYHSDEPEEYAVCVDLAIHITRSLVEDHFDPTLVTVQPKERTLGHAWTYARRRIMRDRVVPMVPVHVNANYPPNRPSPLRCYQFGRSVGEAINRWSCQERVAVLATGGLSHFVVDERFDRAVIDALLSDDERTLSNLPLEKLRSGTSEVLNWVVAAGALRNLSMSLIDYIPAYRSEAGTGVGMAFGEWQKKGVA